MDKDLTIKEICAMNTCDPNRPAILTGDWAEKVLNEPYRFNDNLKRFPYFPYGIEL